MHPVEFDIDHRSLSWLWSSPAIHWPATKFTPFVASVVDSNGMDDRILSRPQAARLSSSIHRFSPACNKDSDLPSIDMRYGEPPKHREPEGTPTITGGARAHCDLTCTSADRDYNC